MARRSLLTPAREERSTAPEPAAAAEPPAKSAARTTKPSRQSKLHIGGYYDPTDDTIISFQKLGIDLRRPQQDMLLEAIRDFVAKHQAAKAFR
ncbi:MAG: Antitoxin-like ribbon-helix-helix [Pseudonocardiales bacterium]|jgi:hypothetical protein|nr:Antitoxin-like ribbon-helix-helix [Pseudonocardiales bacterium]